MPDPSARTVLPVVDPRPRPLPREGRPASFARPARPSLAGMTLPEIRAWAARRGLPAFRAAQLHHGLYRRLALSPLELTDLPLGLREELDREITFAGLALANEIGDGASETTKTLFSLPDGALVEAVMMGYRDPDGRRRHTVCLSSQVGCALGCAFCATGLQGWARDLTAGEMVEQVLYYARGLAVAGLPVTNVVYMGMGEPFLNYEEVLRSVRVLTEREGFGLGARHLTISTSGVVPGILRFAEEDTQAGLAVSLHAPDDALRDSLVPLNRRYPISSLLAACHTYVGRTHRRISFEYTMLAGVNDATEQAEALAALLRGLLCHVNLIPWNTVAGLPYQPSSRAAIGRFREVLAARGLPVTIRDTRGSGISAACGQLRTSSQRGRRGQATAGATAP